MIEVARRYKFRASHHLPGVPGYDQPHEHDYTVEIVVTGIAVDGMVVDTQILDDHMGAWLKLWEGQDLNEKVRGATTVENLAALLRPLFDSIVDGDVAVTVWEDDNRWGRAS